jgi:hypothetical protein
LAERLSETARRLQTARRVALAALDVDETTWEYAGRTWSWPAGEARTYFHELAPGEAQVLERATEQYGARRVGVGTGRVAVELPADTVGSDEPHIAKPQNRRERALWEAIGSHPFLPVCAADDDGDWLVMPRATVPPPPADREVAMSRIRRALAAHDDAFHFDELKPENVGRYDGRYWIVDYGRPPGEPRFVEPP